MQKSVVGPICTASQLPENAVTLMQPSGQATGLKPLQSIAAPPLELVSAAGPDDEESGEVAAVGDDDDDKPDVVSAVLVEDDGSGSSPTDGPHPVHIRSAHARVDCHGHRIRAEAS